MRKNVNFNDSTTASQRAEKVVSILAAFTGLGISAYVTRYLGIPQGSSATIIYLLVGIPSYSLIVMGYKIAYHFLQTENAITRRLSPVSRRIREKIRH